MPKMRSVLPTFGGGEKKINPQDVMGIAPLGMVGGLPEGLNPQAIEEMIKRLTPEAAPMGKAAMDAAKGLIPAAKRIPAASELRMQELLAKFGGLFGK